jgi:glutamine amidotransferase
MCELFGMSSLLPANVTFSLAIVGDRGGNSGPHADGWGVAFREGRDFRVIKEAKPAAESACLRFIEDHDFKSDIVISHIRRATSPKVLSYVNTHPFVRELYGFSHVFAHNGDGPGVFNDPRFRPTHYFPLGDTDSERAFCSLMDRLRQGLTPETVSRVEKKIPIIEEWARELSEVGVFNFLLSDGKMLYARRSTHLYVIVKECLSLTECLRGPELTIRLARKRNGTQRVAVVATEPLTADKNWTPLPEGKVVGFFQGERVF